MRSPLVALGWEIWRRGRLSACWALGCVSFCALVNLAAPERFCTSQAGLALESSLMVLSFLFLVGTFNYTEFNSTRDWNGFPYRLFALPVRTWQLVALPMLLGVAAVELLYMAWIKLVWTHQPAPLPGWIAVVLGAYMVFYQTALWGLAGFRILRVLVLSLGGITSFGVACLPFFSKNSASPWFSEKRLIVVLAGMTFLALVIARAVVGRQRSGGGRRRSWLKARLERIGDALPRRTRDFASPAAAQFWFEWRRSGLLLPICIAFALAFIAPISWFHRTDPRFSNYLLGRILALPTVLAFAIGKGFIKPEFWSTSLSLPAFLAARPLTAGEFVVCKMKVAAVSAVIACSLVVGFVALWLPLWADTTQLAMPMSFSRLLHPYSWPAIVVLCLAALVVLTWRCLVGGLWAGLSGSRSYYLGSLGLQVLAPALVLLVCGLWSDTIDAQIQHHPELVKSVGLSAIGWALALLVILKLWFAVFSWRKISPRRSRQYLLIWSSVTLGFVALGILSAPWADTYRLEHLFVLAAFLLMPLARLGLAPLSLATNRHR